MYGTRATVALMYQLLQFRLVSDVNLIKLINKLDILNRRRFCLMFMIEMYFNSQLRVKSRRIRVRYLRSYAVLIN